MKMGFAETQPSEREFFRAALAEHELQFVSHANEADIDAEVLSVHLQSRIDSTFLEGRPSLKLIATRSTGHDHIDSAECALRGVVVCNVPGSDAHTVAEHAFALMLAVARRLYAVREARKQPRFYYERFRSFDLKDKTLGVIGTGRIGLRVVHIALAFGMHVLAYDPHRRSLMAEIVGTRYVSLDELLRASHVISLHAPLTPETYHLLDREAFAKCRPGVVIINTARGALIDTKALIEALDAGQVGGAGLDVLEDESVMQKEGARIITEQIVARLRATTSEEVRMQRPERVQELEELFENRRLLARAEVVFTPHVAFNSVEAVERINAMTVENIRAFLQGAPVNVVEET
jgi:D-lactate dehydrogenase